MIVTSLQQFCRSSQVITEAAANVMQSTWYIISYVSYIILHCIVLYYIIILNYIRLHYYIMSYCIVFQNIICILYIYWIISYYILLHYITLYYIILHLNYFILYYIVLYTLFIDIAKIFCSNQPSFDTLPSFCLLNIIMAKHSRVKLYPVRLAPRPSWDTHHASQ